VIAGIQELTDIPIAVLTNGSLLWNDEVVDALARADVILPSLDVGDAALFQHVNRPHGSISFDAMVGGLEGLRDRCRGEIWLEVLLLAGVTGLDAEVRKIEAIVERIRPDRVQLNTAVRPTAEEFAFALSREEMQRLAQCMGPNSEIIANFRGVHEAAQFRAKREDVLRVLERRPCTVRDLAASLSLHVNEATKYVGELEQKGQVVLEAHYGALYYRARGLPEEVK
jgi:wyosine [tRNA(Phe)-imidazoG37] synthetase (radical SAM superfamily)